MDPNQHQQNFNPYLHQQLPIVPVPESQYSPPQPATSFDSPFTHPGILPTQQVPSADGVDRARAYKSRNKRPCDFCRYKKAACHLESQPPCELCIRYGKECTFVELPAKRRRPNEQNQDGTPKHDPIGTSRQQSSSSVGPSRAMSYENHTIDGAGMIQAPDHVSWNHGAISYDMNSVGLGISAMDPGMPFHSGSYQEPSSFEGLGHLVVQPGMPSGGSSGGQWADQAALVSSSIGATLSPSLTSTPHQVLDVNRVNHHEALSVQIAGPSGDLDPSLLSHYHYNEQNEVDISGLRVRRMQGVPRTTNAGLDDFSIASRIPSPSITVMPPHQDRVLSRELSELVHERIGQRLLALYHHFIHRHLPVCGSYGNYSDLGSTPTALLAAMYGLAIQFWSQDETLASNPPREGLADALFRLSWLSCMSQLNSPQLSTLQALLLIVQRPENDAQMVGEPFKWTAMTMAVGIAQFIGLNHDPSSWPLPPREINLRKHVAWALLVQEKWLALHFGRHSHISAADWTVPAPSADDFADLFAAEPDQGAPMDPGTFPMVQEFLHLVSLTRVVADILANLYTLTAVRSLGTRLEAILEVAKPCRLRLTEWSQGLPPGFLSRNFDATGEEPPEHRPYMLHLAYITAKIALFRAMLRPRVTDANVAAITALRMGTRAVAHEAAMFLERLSPEVMEGFWLIHARRDFALASSFVILLFITAPTVPDAAESLHLLRNWHHAVSRPLPPRAVNLLGVARARLDGIPAAGWERTIELSPAAAQAWASSGGIDGSIR